jgi:hypothetical protein
MGEERRGEEWRGEQRTGEKRRREERREEERGGEGRRVRPSVCPPPHRAKKTFRPKYLFCFSVDGVWEPVVFPRKLALGVNECEEEKEEAPQDEKEEEANRLIGQHPVDHHQQTAIHQRV